MNVVSIRLNVDAAMKPSGFQVNIGHSRDELCDVSEGNAEPLLLAVKKFFTAEEYTNKPKNSGSYLTNIVVPFGLSFRQRKALLGVYPAKSSFVWR